MLHRTKRRRTSRLQSQRCDRPTFSLRWLLVVMIGFAVLFAAREFFIAFLLGLYVCMYYTLMGTGLLAARFSAATDKQLVRFGRDELTLPALFTVTLISVGSHYLWHGTILLGSWNLMADITGPTFLGISVYGLQRLIHILLHVAITLTWLGNCWTTGRVVTAECRLASAASFLLCCSYFANLSVAIWLVRMSLPQLGPEANPVP